MNFAIDAEACVACLACVRTCPTDAIAVAGEAPLLQVVDELCIRCGQCYAACPHDAVRVGGEVGRAMAVAAQGDGVLILSADAAAHFYPATPEQVDRLGSPTDRSRLQQIRDRVDPTRLFATNVHLG